MKSITVKQIANRISNRINSIPRKDRDFTKPDFSVGSPLPSVIYSEFVAEFPRYTNQEINEFASELNKFVES